MAPPVAEVNGSPISMEVLKAPAVTDPTADGAADIASSINYHARYSPHFSPFKNNPEQAFYATAESVRDSLIQVWHLHLFILKCYLEFQLILTR